MTTLPTSLQGTTLEGSAPPSRVSHVVGTLIASELGANAINCLKNEEAGG